MPAVVFRNEKLYAPRRELVFVRFAKQAVSQLLLTDGMELSQQVVGQIMQCPVAQFARQLLPQKSQTPSGGLLNSPLIPSNSTGFENVIVEAKGQEVGYEF